LTTWLADRPAPRPLDPCSHPSRTAALAGLTILYPDKDFEIVADITGQPLERLNLSKSTQASAPRRRACRPSECAVFSGGRIGSALPSGYACQEPAHAPGLGHRPSRPAGRAGLRQRTIRLVTEIAPLHPSTPCTRRSLICAPPLPGRACRRARSWPSTTEDAPAGTSSLVIWTSSVRISDNRGSQGERVRNCRSRPRTWPAGW
jgi:hypothetical protein